MKKSDVEEWVKALRSGDYQQGKSNLCREDQISGECEYCCLGVACDILTVNEWIKYPHYVVWSIGEHKDFVMTSIKNKERLFWAETTSFLVRKSLRRWVSMKLTHKSLPN